ncbi:hypothetical protein Vadar_021737 [Vaccinium darrowii]|uniref:Uncharacterized protein n=1 Tax=Vaccinium darrowii TaxID=229202 RepID=A0ACB7ZD51_9ERIC|nr:hypothetical protein Vadar_021737 [Vaccinium darrowii]
MYARCGRVDFARQVFVTMNSWTLVSWTSMIVGYAINGYAEEALQFFNSMQKEGLEPDGVSLTGALAACSHAGLVDEGLNVFESCRKVGRCIGSLDVVEKMPVRPNEVVLASLLAAHRTHRDINLADRGNNVRKKMKDFGTEKKAGISSIEIDCNIHEFVVGDKSHAEADEIYAMLEHVCLQLGTSGVRS